MKWGPNRSPAEKIQRAQAEVRRRWGYLTPFRMGLVAKSVGLDFNPYVPGTKAHGWFVDGSGIATTTWPCGHPKTVENTQSVGCAGYRCRECRKRISNASAKRRYRERKEA